MRRFLTVSGLVLSLLVPLGMTPANAHAADYCTTHYRTSSTSSTTERLSIHMEHRWSLRLKYLKCWENSGLTLEHFHPINFRLRMVQEAEKKCYHIPGNNVIREFRMNPSNIGRWDFTEREWKCVTGQTYYTKWIDFAGQTSNNVIGTGEFSDRCFQFRWQVDNGSWGDQHGFSPNVCI